MEFDWSDDDTVVETQFSDDTVRERNDPNQVVTQQEVIVQVNTVSNAEIFRHLRIPRNENAQREMDSMRMLKRREEKIENLEDGYDNGTLSNKNIYSRVSNPQIKPTQI